MANANFYAVTDSIRQSAQLVDDSADTAVNECTSFANSAEGRNGGFPGHTSAPFAEVISSWASEDSAMIGAMFDLSSSLSNAAEGYDQTDDSNCERFHSCDLNL